MCRVELCKTCFCVLTDENWHPYRRANYQRICNRCYRDFARAYRAKELGLTDTQYQEYLDELSREKADQHCKKCGIELTGSNWPVDQKRNNSRICRSCRNEYLKDWLAKYPERRKSYTLKTNFGITLDDVKTLWTKQGEKCWLCNRSLPFVMINIDHDHKSGKIRGLVHSNCNTIAGMSGDDPELLRSIAQSLSSEAAAQQ